MEDTGESMTDAERQQRKRDRIKAGLVRVEVWVPAHAEAAVRAAIEKAVKVAESKEKTKCD